MSKGEFENLIGCIVTDESFNLINFVYTFHPVIDEVHGKRQVADLFLTFGLRIISDMHATAIKAKDLEDAIRSKNIELDTLRSHLDNLRLGFED